jgi:uncharacterized membrane protein
MLGMVIVFLAIFLVWWEVWWEVSGVGVVVIVDIFVMRPWVVSGIGILVRCLASGIQIVIVAIVLLRQQHFSSIHIYDGREHLYEVSSMSTHMKARAHII